MALRSSLQPRSGVRVPGYLSKLLGASIVFGMFAISATGCGGCDDAELVCDDVGNCEICDGYGCHPAEPGVGEGGGGSSSVTTTGTGTTPECDPDATTCPCDAKNKCSDGLSCVDGLCIAGCQVSYQCGAGNVCVNGACTPGCSAQVPCAAGYACQNGACQLDPKNPQCDAQNACAAGQICVGGLCTTGCTANADCAADQICDSKNKACIPDPSPKPSCNDTVKCTGAGQQCLDDGYCHYPCSDVAECKLIDARFVACETYCKTIEEVDPECTIGKPCPEGKDCVSNTCL